MSLIPASGQSRSRFTRSTVPGSCPRGPVGTVFPQRSRRFQTLRFPELSRRSAPRGNKDPGRLGDNIGPRWQYPRGFREGFPESLSTLHTGFLRVAIIWELATRCNTIVWRLRFCTFDCLSPTANCTRCSFRSRIGPKARQHLCIDGTSYEQRPRQVVEQAIHPCPWRPRRAEQLSVLSKSLEWSKAAGSNSIAWVVGVLFQRVTAPLGTARRNFCKDLLELLPLPTGNQTEPGELLYVFYLFVCAVHL